MIMNIYATYDKAAQAFVNQFFDKHHGSVIRGFQDALNNKETDVGRHPTDFELYYLGSLDTDSGEVGSDPECPLKLLSGLDCSKPAIDEAMSKEEYHDSVTESVVTPLNS